MANRFTARAADRLRPLPGARLHSATGKIYIHVMDYAGDLLALSKVPPVQSAKVLASGAAVEVTEIQGGIVLHLPQTRDDADTVIVLDAAR